MIRPECSAIGMKRAGSISPRVGCDQRDKRFDAQDGVAAAVDDRLIDDPQLIGGDRVPQVAFELLAFGQVGIHRRVVDAGTVATLVLGTVERHVGIAHHVGGNDSGPAVDGGNADTCADQNVVAADRIGRADRGNDPFGRAIQGGDLGAAGDDHREFVAAQPADQILGPQQSGQASRDVADEFVADRMAEGVVDVLEMVEVDVENRRRRGAVPDVLDHLFQTLAEKVAVRQAAERIVQGQVAQALFALRDRRCRPSHVAVDQRGEKSKARKRDRDKGNHAGHDLGARPLGLPGEAHDGVSVDSP